MVAGGVSAATLRRRIRAGRWVQPLPGVVCRTTGTLTPDQRRLAAILFGGHRAVLSHRTAASLLGACAAGDAVHITVPHGEHLRSAGFVVVHQSRRLTPVWYADGLPVTDSARSIVDAAGAETSLAEVRAMVCAAVQRRRVTVAELHRELALAPRRGSAAIGAVLEEVDAGVRSVSEAEFLALVRSARLPAPELNAPVVTAAGTKYVDALWRDLAAGTEIDGRACHLDSRSWQADLERQNAIHSTGIVLLRLTAARLRRDPAGAMREQRRFLESRGLPSSQ